MKRLPLRLTCGLLAALLLAPGLCGCHQSKEQDSAHVVLHKDITDYCYIGTVDQSAVYECKVFDQHGFQLFYKTGLSQPPTAEAVDKKLLKVSQQFGARAEGSWAIYCNVETSHTSPLFTNVLLTEGTTVAYTEHLTGAHHVFVRDAMDETVYFKSYTLTDADEGNAVLGGNKNADGDLVVTYLSGGKEKTIVVELP